MIKQRQFRSHSEKPQIEPLFHVSGSYFPGMCGTFEYLYTAFKRNLSIPLKTLKSFLERSYYLSKRFFPGRVIGNLSSRAFKVEKGHANRVPFIFLSNFNLSTPERYNGGQLDNTMEN